jgi:hypothetical protein
MQRRFQRPVRCGPSRWRTPSIGFVLHVGKPGNAHVHFAALHRFGVIPFPYQYGYVVASPSPLKHCLRLRASSPIDLKTQLEIENYALSPPIMVSIRAVKPLSSASISASGRELGL